LIREYVTVLMELDREERRLRITKLVDVVSGRAEIH
jgi:hypothetical protein